MHSSDKSIIMDAKLHSEGPQCLYLVKTFWGGGTTLKLKTTTTQLEFHAGGCTVVSYKPFTMFQVIDLGKEL